MSGANFDGSADLREIVVDFVVPGSAAANAGLRKGDVVTTIDGQPVGPRSLLDLRQRLRREGQTRRVLDPSQRLDRAGGGDDPPHHLSAALHRCCNRLLNLRRRRTVEEDISIIGRLGIGGIVMAGTLAIWSRSTRPRRRRRRTSCSRRSAGTDAPFVDQGAVEIAAYDSKSQRAFLTLASLPRIEVINLSNPSGPSLAHIIDLTPWGGRRPTPRASRLPTASSPWPCRKGRNDRRPARSCSSNVSATFWRRHRRRAARHGHLHARTAATSWSANEGEPNQRLHGGSGRQREHRRRPRRRRGLRRQTSPRRLHALSTRRGSIRPSASSARAQR